MKGPPESSFAVSRAEQEKKASISEMVNSAHIHPVLTWISLSSPRTVRNILLFISHLVMPLAVAIQWSKGRRQVLLFLLYALLLLLALCFDLLSLILVI